MVNINLDSRTTLTSDSKQWVINVDGRATSFFTTIGSALNYYLEQKLRSSDAKTVNTLLLRQKSIVATLNSVITPLEIKVEVSK